jgi:C1A family cysteine protease
MKKLIFGVIAFGLVLGFLLTSPNSQADTSAVSPTASALLEGTYPTTTPQLAPLNPDFIDYLENPPEPFYGYIPPPIDLSLIPEVTQRATIDGETPLRANPNLTYFDWRDTGKVTSVKDQSPCGTCWAFGTLSAVEAKVLIVDNVSYDFSEQNLVCCTDPSIVFQHDDHCNAGGWSWLAADTLMKKGWNLASHIIRA